jgi:hypothetical protein
MCLSPSSHLHHGDYDKGRVGAPACSVDVDALLTLPMPPTCLSHPWREEMAPWYSGFGVAAAQFVARCRPDVARLWQIYLVVVWFARHHPDLPGAQVGSFETVGLRDGVRGRRDPSVGAHHLAWCTISCKAVEDRQGVRSLASIWEFASAICHVLSLSFSWQAGWWQAWGRWV